LRDADIQVHPGHRLVEGVALKCSRWLRRRRRTMGVNRESGRELSR
jgi:hypothetical protein